MWYRWRMVFLLIATMAFVGMTVCGEEQSGQDRTIVPVVSVPEFSEPGTIRAGWMTGDETIVRRVAGTSLQPESVRNRSDYVSDSSPLKVQFEGAPTSGRIPLRVLFFDLSQGSPVSWRWDFGDGGTGSGEEIIHTYTEGGIYTVSLVAENKTGATGTSIRKQYITAYPLPLKANFTVTPDEGQAPLTVQCTDSSTGAMVWSWDFGDGSIGSMIPNPSHTYEKPGTYLIKLTVGNELGKSDLAEGQVKVLDKPAESGSIPISAGWNSISVPETLISGRNTAAIFGHIEADGHSVLKYDTAINQWTILTRTDRIQPRESFWVYSVKKDSVPLTFDPDSVGRPPARSLDKGWNAIGFTGTKPQQAKTALTSVEKLWVNCLRFNNNLQVYDPMIVKGSHDGTLVYPYGGYWLYMSDSGILTG